MRRNGIRRLFALFLAAVLCTSLCTGFTAEAEEISEGAEVRTEQIEANSGTEDTAAEQAKDGEGQENQAAEEQEPESQETDTASAATENQGDAGQQENPVEQGGQSQGTELTEETERRLSSRASAAGLSDPKIEADSRMEAGQKVTWDCVWFGSYPQSEVESTDPVYSTLQSAGGWDSKNEITVNGNRYRRMKKGDATYATSGDRGYYFWPNSTTWHYFKYEPIKWRVLKINGNQAFLLSDVALDDQKYHTEREDVTWETSTIRSWLNGYGVSSNQKGVDYSVKNFIGSAFTFGEQSAIVNTSVVNADNIMRGTAGGNNTTDKVFLLSESEVYGESAASHGFVSSNRTEDEARRCKNSTYAEAMGVYSSSISDAYKTKYCSWWLRSPGYDSDMAVEVGRDGFVYGHNGRIVDYDNIGVRAALNLNLSSNLWSYAGTVCSDGTEDEEGGSSSGGDTSADDNANQTIIERVSEYTSDEIYAQYNAISESKYSYEKKWQMWLELFTSYGITDVCEGIRYLSNTTDKRYAYLNLTTNDIYCASNFQYMLDHTAKGWAMRAVLLADGLVFNGEVNDWLDFSTHMTTEYPGVAKYKAMLYDFMDETSQSIEMQSIIKLVSDLSKNVTGAAKIKTDNFIEQLNSCENIDELYTILQSNKASEVWAELSTKRDEEGNVIFKYKLDDSSGFGQFEKAMGYATKTISIVDMTITDILDLLTLDSKLAIYSQYKRFLKDIWSNTEYIPYQMRWAAALILNEIEEGYLGKIIDIAIDIISQTELNGMVKEVILEKVGASSFSSWLAVINIEAFFINKIADIGEMVKKEAYVEGYAYLANAFTKQLENSKRDFLNDKTEQNAWDFYYNYNILYRLRYKGEESYLAMTEVDGIAGLFSDYGYAARKEVVDDTLMILKERCQFILNASEAIPESCQFATKSVVNCPVNVEVYTIDGNLIATLLDGEESDVTNNYGRFAVVYDSYSGDYIKVICLNSPDIFKFRLIGTDEGLVNMELAQAGENDTVIYCFNNVPISSGMIFEADTEQIIQQRTYNIDKDGDGNSEEEGIISIKDDNQYVSVDSFSLNQEKIELEIGNSDILQTVFSPLEASCQSVFWLSDNPAVATVKDGKVTAISEGKAKIYCTSLDAPDIIVSCEVSVIPQILVEQKYMIIFDTNGGICDTSEIETNAEGKIEKLPEVSREGYEFKGWFTGAESGDEVTEETIFTADTTIYAHWEANEEEPPEKYTITLDANGGDCETGEIETDADGKIEQLPTANREGYVFKGWFTEVQDGEQVTEETVFVADTTIYAHWSVQESKSDGIKKDGNVSGTNNKTNNTAPRTGDNNDLIIWFITVIVSSIILLAYGLFRFKRKKLIL